jgi:hypothetical protein
MPLPGDVGPSARRNPHPRPTRFGRRRTDVQLREIPSKRFVAIAVAVVNLLYLVGEVILSHSNVCG